MGFIDSYKRLEKLCGELYGKSHGVTAYIDEMASISDGARLVQGWSDDLKSLKRLRHLRNMIAHDPDCTEKNTSSRADAKWLDEFHKRIMSDSDPLALYAKAKKAKKAASKPKSARKKRGRAKKKGKNSSTGCMTVIAAVAAVTFVALAILIALLFI